MSDLRITELINDLASLVPPPHSTNMYAWDGADETERQGNHLRRANLTLALTLALARGPDLLLVGEAPGYHGARRTGVPFTSEQLLLNGVDPPGQFGSARGFALATNDGRISREQTATIVYRELAALHWFAVGWNAFPLHPHQPDNPNRNRTPRQNELEIGLPFLARVRAIFPNCPVFAMGRIASQSLNRLGIVHIHLRHPAQGGARQFAASLREAAQQMLQRFEQSLDTL